MVAADAGARVSGSVGACVSGTLGFGLWTLDSGLRTLDPGLKILDFGLWTSHTAPPSLATRHSSPSCAARRENSETRIFAACLVAAANGYCHSSSCWSSAHASGSMLAGDSVVLTGASAVGPTRFASSCIAQRKRAFWPSEPFARLAADASPSPRGAGWGEGEW